MLALVMLSMLFTWLIVAGVCVGIGGLLLRSLGFGEAPAAAEGPEVLSLAKCFWAGVSISAAILQLYHFFRPVDLGVVFLLLVLAVAGWIWNQRALVIQVINFPKTQAWAVLLFVPAVLIIAFRGAGPCEHYDTGLYGAPSIRWITTYPMVPGLGNLLGQLGFNSTVHLWMAALDQGPWRHLSYHLFVGLLIAALFAFIFPAVVRILCEQEPSAVDWFAALLFVPAAIWACRGKIAAADTDLPTSVVCLVAVLMVLRGFAEEKQARQGTEVRIESLVVATLLFSLALTFKVSCIVFVFLGWILAVARLRELSRGSARGKQLMAATVVLSGVLLLGWFCRGLVLTGYPLFPSKVISFPVDWKLPVAFVDFEILYVRSFARIPQIPLADTEHWRWLIPWLRELVREREGFLIPALFAMAGVIVALMKKFGHGQHGLPRWLWLLAPSFAGLVFWFIEAPAIRFGEPLFWTMGGTLGALAAMRLLDNRAKRSMALLGVLILTGWAAHPRLLWGSYFLPSLGVHSFLPLPKAKLERRATASGLIIFVPVNDNKCWDPPLPCSGYVRPTLRLRRPGDLSSGFAADKSASAM